MPKIYTQLLDLRNRLERHYREVQDFEFTDSYGNLCQRLIAPPGPFAVHTAAVLMTMDRVDRAPGAPFVEIQDLPDSVLAYLLPSRYCESERFGEMATDITAGQWLGYNQVAAIEAWLRNNIRVITSYSIHYTKLYEAWRLSNQLAPMARIMAIKAPGIFLDIRFETTTTASAVMAIANAVKLTFSIC